MELAPAPELGGYVKSGMELDRSDRTGVLTIRQQKAGVGCGGLLQLAAMKPADPTLARTFKALCGR
jgi:hypothetical protein